MQDRNSPISVHCASSDKYIFHKGKIHLPLKSHMRELIHRKANENNSTQYDFRWVYEMEPTWLNIPVDLLFYQENILTPLEREIHFILFSPTWRTRFIYSSQNDIRINTYVSQKEDVKFIAKQCNFVYRRSRTLTS